MLSASLNKTFPSFLQISRCKWVKDSRSDVKLHNHSLTPSNFNERETRGSTFKSTFLSFFSLHPPPSIHQVPADGCKLFCSQVVLITVMSAVIFTGCTYNENILASCRRHYRIRYHADHCTQSYCCVVSPSNSLKQPH